MPLAPALLCTVVSHCDEYHGRKVRGLRVRIHCWKRRSEACARPADAVSGAGDARVKECR
jgi:hypothetical protein